MKIDLQKIAGLVIENRESIIGAAKAIKTLVGKSKSGAEKKELLKAFIVEQVPEIAELLEGITGKDLVNNEALDRVVSDAAELGYEIMKLRTELEEKMADLKVVLDSIKQLRPAKPFDVATPGDGTGVR